ncbi:MAG: trimethylamine methyltransferase family protein [Ardenticatenales bacterium]|nr:trimethylamine methyltransferase family protein [Ardenticatenales bacterium]
MGQRQDRRPARRRDRQGAGTAQVSKIVQPVNRLPIYDLLDEEGVQLIHQKSLEILRDIGIAFLDDEAQSILKTHGVKVQDNIAYFDPDLILSYVRKAPAQFTQLARNPERNVIVGGHHQIFAPVYGPPFVVDSDQGRREATLKDFDNFVKLAYLSPYMHHSGGTIVEPTDEHTDTRHLDMVFSHIRHSDKPFMGSVTSGQNAADSVAMAEILFGKEEIRQNPALISLINVSSPRRLDDRMLGALMVYARARQAMILSPFVLSGAMAPVSIAGTVIQLNAEALATIAFAQMVEAGTPIVYGAFQSTIDLQSGAPVFGAPESQLALFASAQMARFYGVPFRSGGMFASSKIADSQAAYESVMAMYPVMQAHVNFVLHAAGWLEGGLSAGYEKFVMDCELLGMYHTFAQGIDLSDEALAMESIAQVEPGGHHLGTPHTMRHFRSAFYRAELFDYNSAEQWQIEGSLTAMQRANAKYKQLLKAYERPALDPGIEEALRDYMARRKLALRG